MLQWRSLLLAAYRSFLRALVPLIPVLLATGWSSLVLWLSQIPLNPMSAALGALTIAIATEFSVILAARFREERGGGLGGGRGDQVGLRPHRARRPCLRGDGPRRLRGADRQRRPMLRDFGFVTVIDLAVALLGVMIALPAALVWLEER